MPRSFDFLTNAAQGGTRFRLQVSGIALAVLNGVALFLYVDPPGGSRAELTRQAQQLRYEMLASRGQTARLKTVSQNVQLGSSQGTQFESKYFLPKRTAYAAVIAEVQRMAKASGLQERDGVFSEEPIEGTSDLTLLNMTANYEGSYESLLSFLREADRSPMLLMLDALQAAPVQKGGQINTSIRFQAIVRDESGANSGVLQ
jgi:Tfp pilus assembly protein PilO